MVSTLTTQLSQQRELQPQAWHKLNTTKSYNGFARKHIKQWRLNAPLHCELTKTLNT